MSHYKYLYYTTKCLHVTPTLYTNATNADLTPTEQNLLPCITCDVHCNPPPFTPYHPATSGIKC